MASSLVFSERAAWSAALPAMKVVRLACTPTSHGFTEVSLLITARRSSGMPSSSATIMASTVSDPCPISLAPVSRVTVPKSSNLRMAPHPSERYTRAPPATWNMAA
jgi:hypothetical protein